MSEITTPTWTMVGDMQREIDMLHAENALKQTQILGLEQLLYETRRTENEWYNYDSDVLVSFPCWCAYYNSHNGEWEIPQKHIPECIKARQATEPFWKK